MKGKIETTIHVCTTKTYRVKITNAELREALHVPKNATIQVVDNFLEPDYDMSNCDVSIEWQTVETTETTE